MTTTKQRVESTRQRHNTKYHETNKTEQLKTQDNVITLTKQRVESASQDFNTNKTEQSKAQDNFITQTK